MRKKAPHHLECNRAGWRVMESKSGGKLNTAAVSPTTCNPFLLSPPPPLRLPSCLPHRLQPRPPLSPTTCHPVFPPPSKKRPQASPGLAPRRCLWPLVCTMTPVPCASSSQRVLGVASLFLYRLSLLSTLSLLRLRLLYLFTPRSTGGDCTSDPLYGLVELVRCLLLPRDPRFEVTDRTLELSDPHP